MGPDQQIIGALLNRHQWQLGQIDDIFALLLPDIFMSKAALNLFKFVNGGKPFRTDQYGEPSD